ncbi:disulfide bond formation protein B [Pseudomonas sp. 3A(2025)]
MHLARTRFLFFLAFIACAISVGAAVYLQYTYGLNPCLLCQWQRALLVVCGLACLVAALHGPTARGWPRYATGLLIMALFGAGVAGAHIGLQTSTPEQLGLMSARLEQGFDSLQLSAWGERLNDELIRCAEINWSLFGISLPEWSLLAFVGLILLALYPLLAQMRRKIVPDDQTLV